ncbi:MAG: FAD-binding oxidoreductase, partial [Leptonema sp. (in: bacteria)]
INIKEIQFILFIANQYKIPITFRTAGTSLSGQAVGNGIVVDIGFSDGWNSYEILNNGKSIKFEPAIIGQHLNLFLRHYSSKIGPDPASINSCMMGGILANNASGMCCGVQFNSYHTLQNIKVVLYNGYVLDTFDPNCEEKLKNDVPEIYEKVLEIKNQILNNPSLLDKIKKKYAIKNTIGYSLNAFIDFEKVSDIIAHLMIGSEGTLGYIAEAELKTIPDLPFKYTGILSFPDIFTACESIPYLVKINAVAVELMDRAAIRSIEDKPEIPSDLKNLPEDATCLLVEFEFSSKEELHQFKRELNHHLKNFRLLYQPEFTDDPYKRNILWKVRKGLFPSVGAVREKGTTVIIEDIAFPLDKLPYATIELQKLFKKHHYDNAIIFGHAKDGNLHFVITQSFNHPKFIEQYDKFMKDVVELVAEKYHGSLKAEHGTGRNMAPFVELEW